MKPNESNDILDIIFRTRNKVYGAYELRKSYPKTITYALLGALLLTGISLFGALNSGNDEDEDSKRNKKKKVVDVVLDKLPETEDKKEEIQEVKPPPVEKIEKYTPPQITSDAQVNEENEIKEQEEMKGQVGAINQEGEVGEILVDPNEQIDVRIEEDDNKVIPYYEVQEKAEADYDYDEFIINQLKYPEYEESNNIEGTVKISFVVEKDGSITGVKVYKTSGNENLDKEAVRVIKMLKPWKPAKQNGKSTRMSMIKPVTFDLAE